MSFWSQGSNGQLFCMQADWKFLFNGWWSQPDEYRSAVMASYRCPCKTGEKASTGCVHEVVEENGNVSAQLETHIGDEKSMGEAV